MILWWLVAPVSKKNAIELKGWHIGGGASLPGTNSKALLLTCLPVVHLCSFVCVFPVKRLSFQKSLLSLERIVHSQERSQASHAKVFRQPSGNSRLPERHLMGFTLHNSHLHRLTPHTAPHLTPHTLLFS